MGTSVNQRSPKTANWSAVEQSYTHPQVPIQRAVQEIWRASSNDVDGGLISDLGKPIIGKCIEIVQNAKSPIEAGKQIRQLIAFSGEASLAGDIAQRAAVASFYAGKDKTESFVSSLFSEASNYLVSRDLPGFVGVTDKLKTVRDATSLKSSIIQEVASQVASVSKPSGSLSEAHNWKSFVNDVRDRLSGAR